MRLTHNLHVHSVVSNCAKREMLIPDIAAEAERAGLDTIAVVDHIDLAEEPDREAAVLANRQIVEKLDGPVQVLAGCETTLIAPGVPAASERTRLNLDIVLLALNHYHLANVERPRDETPRAYAEHHLVMMRSAAALPYVHAIAHPFCHTKLPDLDRDETLSAYDLSEVRETLALLAQAGIRLEINPGHVRVAPQFFGDVARIARQVGLRFATGTDAHRLENIAYGDHVGPLLESIGLQEEDIALPDSLRPSQENRRCST